MRNAWLTGMLVGVTLSTVVLSITAVLRAQGTPQSDCCVAWIDVGRIYAEYQRTKDVTEELRRLQNELESENQQRKEGIQRLETTVDAMDRTDPNYTTKMHELLSMTIEHRNWFDVKQASISREIAVTTDSIYRDILRGTRELSESVGYDIVLYFSEHEPAFNTEEIQAQMRARKIGYGSPGTDITQLVLEKLNRDYRSKPPQPQLQIP